MRVAGARPVAHTSGWVLGTTIGAALLLLVGTILVGLRFANVWPKRR